MNRLELSGVVSGYGSTKVIREIDLSIAPGELVALFGRNGMGKTTVLRTIVGQLPLMAGTRSIDGATPSRPERIARAGVAFVPDDRGVLPTLTVEENLRLARRRGYTPAVDVAELLPVIRQRARVKAADLSGGQKQQLALARAVLFGSRLVVVDELSQGLQPSLVEAVLQALSELAAHGVSGLVVDQSPEVPVRHCHRVLGMDKGRIVLDRPVADVRADPALLDALLVVS